jgi:hypothetical protein
LSSSIVAQTTKWRLVWKDINNTADININHYNIYRNTKNTISIVNTEPIGQSTETNFVDTTVQPGIEYYYWVTSVDENGNESDTSRSASATIPNIIMEDKTFVSFSSNFTMLLDEYVEYFPLLEKEKLIWEILTQHDKFFLDYETISRKLEITAPSSEGLTEKLILKVTIDPGFYDIDSTILLSSTQSQDTTIYAYPIPFNSNLDGHEHIEFSGLSDGQTISIYDLLGRYVYKNSDPDIPFKWDVLNNAGSKINSGIYIYIIKDEEENKVTSGKLIVIR